MRHHLIILGKYIIQIFIYLLWSLTRGGFVSAKAFKIGIAALITCAVAASVAVPLATTVFKSSGKIKILN